MAVSNRQSADIKSGRSLQIQKSKKVSWQLYRLLNFSTLYLTFFPNFTDFRTLYNFLPDM